MKLTNKIIKRLVLLTYIGMIIYVMTLPINKHAKLKYKIKHLQGTKI